MTALTREQVELMLARATPGPWKSDDLDRVVAPYMCINGLSALFEIAWISIPHDSERGYTDDAFNPDVAAKNLALIAAAPDLATALLAAWDREAKLREAVDEFASLDTWVSDSLQEGMADIPDDMALARFRAMAREWFGAGVGASFADSLTRARVALGDTP